MWSMHIISALSLKSFRMHLFIQSSQAVHPFSFLFSYLFTYLIYLKLKIKDKFTQS